MCQCQIRALITYAVKCPVRCFYEKQSQNLAQKELEQKKTVLIFHIYHSTWDVHDHEIKIK